MKTRLPLLLFLAACTGDTTDDTGDTLCTPTRAVATDIDETLTTSDGEWVAQLANPAHDPEQRPDASATMQAYREKGYTIYYVTARGTAITLGDGRSATEATEDWLDAHDYPRAEGDLYLAEGASVAGDAAVDYKKGVIEDLMAEGVDFAWAYGNAESDILGFQGAGIPDANIFLVGDLAGTMGVQALPDEDAYTSHLASHLPTVADACE